MGSGVSCVELSCLRCAGTAGSARGTFDLYLLLVLHSSAPLVDYGELTVGDNWAV